LFWHDALILQIVQHSLNICFKPINFVDGDDDGHVHLASELDDFDGLLLDRLYCRDHQNDDVSHLGSPRAQVNKSFVAGRVDERHFALSLVLELFVGISVRELRSCDGEGANRLGDRTVLLGTLVVICSEGIEQCGLAVVDMAHDRDDWCTTHELVFALLVLLDEIYFFVKQLKANELYCLI
jgi:hypothetical protein